LRQTLPIGASIGKREDREPEIAQQSSFWARARTRRVWHGKELRVRPERLPPLGSVQTRQHAKNHGVELNEGAVQQRKRGNKPDRQGDNGQAIFKPMAPDWSVTKRAIKLFIAQTFLTTKLAPDQSILVVSS